MFRNVQRSPIRATSDSDLMKIVSPAHDDCGSVTQRDKRRRISIETHDDLTAFRIEMKDLFENFVTNVNRRIDGLEKHIFDVKSNMTTISSSNKDIETSINFVSEQLHAVEAKINNLEEERKSLTLHISSLEEKCEDIQRNMTKTCIEIRNVPKNPNEGKTELFEMVHKLSSFLSINLDKSNVRDVYRIPNKTNKEMGTLIVEFCNTLTKANVLGAIKKLKKENHSNQLNSRALGISNPTTTIYISEHLTPKARRLHSLARDFAKRENYNFCWIANGRVFLRTKEGQPYTVVRNEAHLNSLRNKTP